MNSESVRIVDKHGGSHLPAEVMTIALDDATINKLSDAIVEKLRRSQFNPDEPWDVEMVAAYMKVSVRQVRERFAVVPGFPQAIRFPSGGKKIGYPKYYGEQIIAWVKKHQEKRRA